MFLGFLRLGWVGSCNIRFNINFVNVFIVDQICYIKNFIMDSNNVFFGIIVFNKFYVFNILDVLQFVVNKG